MNPWNIIGWLVLLLLVAVVVVGISMALDQQQSRVVRTADVPRGAREAAPRDAPAASASVPS